MDVDYLRHIDSYGAAVLRTPVASLSDPVGRYCANWSIGELITHLGAVHRWATAHVAGEDAIVSIGQMGSSAPSGGGALFEWYRDGLESLVAHLNSTDADSMVPSFIGPATAGFWRRRQALELAVHYWDLCDGLGTPPGVIDPSLAASGIEEWLEVFAPRVFGAERPPELMDQVIVLRPNDFPVQWRFALTDQGIVRADDTVADSVVVSGPIATTFLTLWRRGGLADFDVQGDVRVPMGILDRIIIT